MKGVYNHKNHKYENMDPHAQLVSMKKYNIHKRVHGTIR